MEKPFDPTRLPFELKESIKQLAGSMIYAYGYAPEDASKIVDYYLHFYDAHQELREM